MDPLAASTKKINSDDRKKLQASTQAPEAHQLFKGQGEQASDKIIRLARDVPRLPRAEDYEQGGPKLPGESTPHDTLGPDTLQSTEYTTNAKPRLPSWHVLTNMPAKKGMDKQQLNQEEAILQKKNPADGARRHVKAVASMQQTCDPTTSAMLSSPTRTRLARDPPLEAGHEQPKAGKVESEMGQTLLGGISPAVLSPAQQTAGGIKIKIPTLKRASHHPGGNALNILSGSDVSSAIRIRDSHSPPQAQHFTSHAIPTTHAMPSPQQASMETADYMPQHQDCIDISDILAQDFVTESRYGLSLTLEGTEHHLRLHNNICGRLVAMLTTMLLRTDIPASERHTLGLLSKFPYTIFWRHGRVGGCKGGQPH